MKKNKKDLKKIMDAIDDVGTEKVIKKPVLDLTEFIKEQQENSFKLLSNKILEALKTDTEQGLKDEVKIKIQELKTEITNHLSILHKDFDKEIKEAVNEGDNLVYEEIEVLRGEFDEATEQISTQFESLDKLSTERLLEFGKKLEELSKAISLDFTGKLTEFKKTHDSFDKELKSLQGGHSVSLSRFDIIDKNFLKFEKDLKKYAKNIYEYGSQLAVLGNGSLIGTSGQINFKNGTNTTVTVTANTQGGIDVAINSSGGGLTRIDPTGIVNGTNTAFVFSSKPTYIVSDHAWYQENKGWTWSGSTATMTVPPLDDIWGFK